MAESTSPSQWDNVRQSFSTGSVRRRSLRQRASTVPLEAQGDNHSSDGSGSEIYQDDSAANVGRDSLERRSSQRSQSARTLRSHSDGTMSSSILDFGLVAKAALLIKRAGRNMGIGQSEDTSHDCEASSSEQNFEQRARQGEIAFRQGGLTQYCIVPPDASPDQVFQHLLFSESAWDLEVPKLVLSVMGGAGQMNIDPEDVASISKGLVEAALTTHAWVITGGTKSGVMDMVGKAMREYDKYHMVPCIGITAFGALTSHWRELLTSEEGRKVPECSTEGCHRDTHNGLPGTTCCHSCRDSDGLKHGYQCSLRWSKQDKKIEHRGQVDAAGIEGKKEVSKDANTGKEFPLVEMQGDHTHSILIDNGVKGHQAFASEANFRATFEEFAGKRMSEPPEVEDPDRGEFSRSMSPVFPYLRRVTSGPFTPPNWMTTSGRSISSPSSSPSRARSKMQSFSSTEVPRVMVLVNGGKFSLDHLKQAIEHSCPLVVCKGTGRLADAIVTLCESYSDLPAEAAEDDKDKALEKVYDKAMDCLKPDTLNEVQKQMLYSIVKSELVEIFSKKERLEDVILRAVIEKKSKTGAEQQLLLAIEWRCTDQYSCICQRFVEEFAGNDLQGDFRAEKVREAIRSLLCLIPRWSHQDHAHFGGDAKDGWGPLVTHLLKHYRKELEHYQVKEVRWTGLRRNAWTSVEGLLIWAIENEAPDSVIEAIWMVIEDPVHACLVGASVCRQTVEDCHSSDSYKDELDQQHLEALADRFEKIGIALIQDVAITRGEGPIKFLFQGSARWDGNDCFNLAHKLGCKLFVSSSVYKLAVDQYWMTPMPFDFEKQPLPASHWHWKKILFAMVWAFWPWENHQPMSKWELWTVPRVKACTHGFSRMVFLCIYSWAVFAGHLADGTLSTFEPVLFIWGMSYALVEVRQMASKGNFMTYISDPWNFLDAVHISVLLVALVVSWLFGDAVSAKNELEYFLELAHAVNLLPSYLRALQSFQLSEYFGTLLMTVYGMCRDALYFFALLVVFCLAFSSALTPILWSQNDDRWSQGVTWAFWSIFGPVDDAKARLEKIESWSLRYLAHSLLFLLSLFSNTLLANLLIALMNNTYEEKKNASALEWAFNRVDAVLEFNEAADLPPPLNLVQFGFNLIFKSGSDEGKAKNPKMKRVAGLAHKGLQEAKMKALKSLKFDDEYGGDKEQIRSLQSQLEETQRHNMEAQEPEASELHRLRKENLDFYREREDLRRERTDLQQRVADLQTELDKLRRAAHENGCEQEAVRHQPHQNGTLGSSQQSSPPHSTGHENGRLREKIAELQTTLTAASQTEVDVLDKRNSLVVPLSEPTPAEKPVPLSRGSNRPKARVPSQADEYST